LKAAFWSSIIILEHFDILSNTKGMFLSIIAFMWSSLLIRSKGTSEFRQPFVNK
jgi:hypothetical protein